MHFYSIGCVKKIKLGFGIKFQKKEFKMCFKIRSIYNNITVVI